MQDTRHVMLKHQIQNLKQQILQQSKQSTLLQFEIQQLLQEQQEQQQQICLARNQTDTLQQSNLLYHTFIRNSKLFSAILKEYSTNLMDSSQFILTNVSSTSILEHYSTLVKQIIVDLESNEMQFLQQGTFGTKNSLPNILHQFILQQPLLHPHEFIHALSHLAKESIFQIQNEQVVSFEQFAQQKQQQEQQFVVSNVDTLLQTKQSQHLNLFLQTQIHSSQIQSLQKEFQSIVHSQFSYKEHDLKSTKLQDYFSLQTNLFAIKQTLQRVQQQETIYSKRKKEAKEKQQQMHLKMKKLETVQIRSEQKRQWIQQLVVQNMHLKKGFTTKQSHIVTMVQERAVQLLIPTILELTVRLQHSVLHEIQAFETVSLQPRRTQVIEREEEWIDKLYQICKLAPSKSIHEMLHVIWNHIAKQDYVSIVQFEEEKRSKTRIQQLVKKNRNVVDFVEWEQMEMENAEKVLPLIKECIQWCKNAIEREVKQVQVMQFEWSHQPAKGIF